MSKKIKIKVNKKQRRKRIIGYKKTIATLGSLIIFFIAIYSLFNDLRIVELILWPLIVFVSALFGIKTAGGVMIQKHNKEFRDE